MAEQDVSRRDFLKGAGVAAVAVTAGLAGCAAETEAPASSSAVQDASSAPEESQEEEVQEQTPEDENAQEAESDQEEQDQDAPEDTQETPELIYQAYVNPQDYDYRSHTTNFSTLLSPFKIGPLEIGHRMVKSAAGSATYLAGYTDELYQYYLNFAKGGVELIWVEGEAFSLSAPAQDGADQAEGDQAAAASSDAAASSSDAAGSSSADAVANSDAAGSSSASSDASSSSEASSDTADATPTDAVEFFRKLNSECNELGAHLGFQWAPFGMPVDEESMSVEDIHAIQATGVALAVQLKDMGFEAIEINAAGFNQGEQFLSRFHNTRTDEYGADTIENRARFVVECIQQIKEACGQDFVVQVLIDCVEEYDDMANGATLMTLDSAFTAQRNKVTTVEEGIALAQHFEAAGADAMHLRLGPLGNHPCQFGSDLYFIVNGVEGASGYGTQFDFARHFGGQLVANHSGAGMLFNVGKRYKEALNIPCGIVTYMDPAHAPDYFEQALAEGCADFYLMTRPLTVDPDYVNKIKQGRLDEIAPCTRCLHCHIGSNEMNRAMGYCRVNALTQRVFTEGGPASYELDTVSKPKKVMVVGGGPAGMEAARIAGLRGHNVTLYEKESQLGGLLTFANLVKGPHENLEDLRTYLEHQCELANVAVIKGTEVTEAVIKADNPDVIILACGGQRDTLDVEGATVVDIEDFMSVEGENVVVYGSNAQAMDIATWLAVHRKNVAVVTPSPNEDIDMQQSQHAQRFLLTTLYALGVRVVPEATIDQVEDGVAHVYSADLDATVQLPCDAIVNAADMLPNKDLLKNFKGTSFTVGDCNEPFNIALAICAGNTAGRAV